MANGARADLALFRRAIGNASTERLAPILACVLDDVVELLEKVSPMNAELRDMVAALADEMHRRNPLAPPVPASGNA